MKMFKYHPLVAAISLAASAGAMAQEVIEEEVLITGFRQAQAAALDAKRNSANNVDSIIAEDIGKMPDLNLAESLQRIPGVAITREGGEGRKITVRGLGPGFTRTTLNGMEVPASTGGLDSSGGVNRSRDFDFNVFGSELFKQININKTAIAHIEEGGLASTVELYTLKPFDAPGLSLNASVQTSHNLQTGESDPRFTGLYSQTFADDSVGVLLAYSHSTRTVHQNGFGTVRWTSPINNGNRSWVGTDADVAISGGPVNWATNNPSVDITDVDGEDRSDQTLDFAWHPRLPRMDSFNRDQTRDGYVAALQFRPNDSMEFALDIVGSSVEADVTGYNYFAMFRNTQQAILPVSVTLDSSGRYITAGSFEDVQTRSESRGQFSDTDFLQTVLSGKFTLSDTSTLKVMYGNASAEHVEEQYRYNLTADTPSSFSYSFLENSNVAAMSYGFDILDPSQYSYSGPTFRHEEVERDNSTFRVDYDIQYDNSSFLTGLIWNNREITSKWFDPINLVDADDRPDVTEANTRLLSEVVSDYGDGIGAPSGFPDNWLVSDFDVAVNDFNAGDFEFDPFDSKTYDIAEESVGAYIEANVDAELLDLPLRVNAGLRMVETTVTSKGFASDGEGGTINTHLEKSYLEILPSTNIVLELKDDLWLRFNMARNFSRPGLGDMAGTVTVTPINGNVSVGNPGLDPIKSDSVDISAEWYFTEESVLAFTLFHKELTGFITGQTLEGQNLPDDIRDVVAARPEYDPGSPLYDPLSVGVDDSDWNISTSVNGDGADVDGYELSYQQFLPMGLGFMANYTHVESEAEFGNGIRGSLEGLSENSYNLGIFYETENYGARVMLNNRDDYVTDQTGSNGNASHGTTGPTRVDLSGFWNATDMFTVTLEVINATNEKERLYTTGPVGDLDLVREYNTTGTEVLFGVRASF